MEDRKRLFQLIQTLKSDSYQPPHLQNPQETRSSNNPTAAKTTSPPIVKENVSPAVNTTVYQQSQSTSQQQQQTGRMLNAYGIPVAQAAASSSLPAKSMSSTTTSYKNTSISQSSLQKNVVTSNSSLVTPASERIRVCVRKRPLNSKERKRNELDVTSVNGRRTIVITESKFELFIIIFQS
jgi:hypothetical protein